MDADYSYDHPSPTKKRRTAAPPSNDALPFTLPGLASHPQQPSQPPQASYATPSQPPPLQPLPAPVALLALASSLRTTVHSLLPQLSKRPASSSPSSNARYAYAWQSYSQSLAACVMALRAAGEVCRGSGEWRGGRVELRVNAMLAEQLVEMYEEDEGGIKVVAGEAEEAMAKALSIAQSHPSLHAYQPPLLLLQTRLSLATHKPLKHTRQLLRRLLSLLPAPTSPSSSSSSVPAPTPAQTAAFYAAHSLSATLPHREVSNAERAASWRTVSEAARQRGDEGVAVVATLAEARLALEVEDYARCSSLLSSLEASLGGEGDAAGGAAGAGGGAATREARIMYRLLRTIVLAQTDVKAAREVLKGTHRLLDAPPADAAGVGVESGTAKTIIAPSPPSSNSTPTSSARPPSASLTFHLPPHSTLYPFTFLLSTTLHLDPFGRSPRSLLFGAEGLRAASLRLNARDPPPPGSALRKLGVVKRELERTSRLKVALGVACARGRTMRGEFWEAEEELRGVVETARGWGVWDSSEAEGEGEGETGEEEEAKEVRECVTLAWGLNRLARAAREGEDEREAERCFEAVIASCSSSPSAPSQGGGGKKASKAQTTADDDNLNPRRKHGRKIAMLSLLLLRMSAPALNGTASGGEPTIPSFAVGSPFPSPTKTFSHHHHHGALPSPSPSPAPPSPFLPSSTTSNASTSASYTPLSTLLSHLTPTPLQILLDAHPPTSLDLLSLLAHAVTAREITTLKKALTGALSATNELQSNWVRVGVLGVLGVVFGWTREGEAHKMISSSYKLAASMGPPSRVVSVPSSSFPSASSASSSSIFPGAPAAETVAGGKGTAGGGGEVQVQVGYARMQAWVGERLLETYRSNPSLASPQQVQEIQRAVQACKKWMEGVEKEAAGAMGEGAGAA